MILFNPTHRKVGQLFDRQTIPTVPPPHDCPRTVKRLPTPAGPQLQVDHVAESTPTSSNNFLIERDLMLS